jgi:hypothetical protein
MPAESPCLFVSLFLLAGGLGAGCGDGEARVSHANGTGGVGQASTAFPGNYGFLTDYNCQDDEATARSRIDQLIQTFNVVDIQFYDWFVDYSTPVSGTSWTDPWSHTRPICLQTIQWYIDEIHVQGGRAWAYVQSVASDDPNLADADAGIYPLLDASGQPYLMGQNPTYFANAAWAQHQVGVWGLAVASLGFDGIHWDTLGPIAGDYQAETAGFHAFLQTAGPLLAQLGLDQTMNFVNLSWWDDSLLPMVAFPYAEVWSMSVEQDLYALMSQPAMQNTWIVMPFYPSVDMPQGWTQSQVMIARWNEAPQHQVRYLVVGDGLKRLVDLYFPDDVALTSDEVTALSKGPMAVQ